MKKRERNFFFKSQDARTICKFTTNFNEFKSSIYFSFILKVIPDKLFRKKVVGHNWGLANNFALFSTKYFSTNGTF